MVGFTLIRCSLPDGATLIRPTNGSKYPGQILDAGHKKLPLVIPLLFYHGAASPYPYSLCWLDEFDDPESARQLYSTAFPLIDITVMPDDQIMQHRRMALLELIQKHIRKRDLMGLVEKLAILLVKGHANDYRRKITTGRTP